jgi:hypothetical protein
VTACAGTGPVVALNQVDVPTLMPMLKPSGLWRLAIEACGDAGGAQLSGDSGLFAAREPARSRA